MMLVKLNGIFLVVGVEKILFHLIERRALIYRIWHQIYTREVHYFISCELYITVSNVFFFLPFLLHCKFYRDISRNLSHCLKCNFKQGVISVAIQFQHSCFRKKTLLFLTQSRHIGLTSMSDFSTVALTNTVHIRLRGTVGYVTVTTCDNEMTAQETCSDIRDSQF